MKYHPSNHQVRSRIRFALTVTVMVLTVLTAGIPGALALMRRADARTALGNAKSLRLALQMSSAECRAAGRPFRDITCPFGITEEAWQKTVMDSKVPGDFWVLQTGENCYEVLRFYYREGDFIVFYCREPLTYEVYYQQPLIQTDFPERT